MSDAPEKISRAERQRRQALAYHEQQAEAEASCVPCKLCGGKAVVKDAGPGWGYYIECENAFDSMARGRGTCLQSGVRLSGWAYNCSEMWNRLNATSAALAEAPEVAKLIERAILDAQLRCLERGRIDTPDEIRAEAAALKGETT